MLTVTRTGFKSIFPGQTAPPAPEPVSSLGWSGIKRFNRLLWL